MANPIKPNLKTEILPISFIIISILASFYFYANFPPIVPTHWDLAGRPNGYSSAAFAAFFLPILLVGIYLLFLALPYLDPKKERYLQFSKIYHIFKDLIIAVMAMVYFVASLTALGYNLNMNFWVPGIVGLLFIIMGNYLGKLNPNWFIGIRTPWTLSSEEVWNKTHRFGGKIFILGGLLMVLTIPAPDKWKIVIFTADIIIILLGTVVYSYVIFLKERGNKKDDNQ